MIPFTKPSIIAFCLGFSGPGGSAIAGDASKAHAAYPQPFSRPPTAERDSNTWRGAAGPDIGATAVDPARLPARVDNSARPQFPPIYQQKWGTCGQYASIASVFTYEMNVLNGTIADTDATRFPAYFSWNMINGAKNVGSEAFHGWEVAKRIGVPSIQTYGGIDLKKIGLWPNGYPIWREAMEYRVAGYRYSPATTIDQVNEARGWLYDRNQAKPDAQTIGGIFAMDGRMGDLTKITVTIPQGEHAAGEDLWTRWGPTGFGHGLTCVGYDDQVGYDLNGDGKITNDLDRNGDGKVTLADWERGAWIIVNSWGKEWSGDGRIYLPYSAMVDADWERGNYLGRIEVARYQPRMTLRLKLACDDRTDLRLDIGITDDPDAIAPRYEFAPEAFNGWQLFGTSNAGHVPMAGPNDPTPIEVGIDITSLLADLGPDNDGIGRLFLRLSRADESRAVGKLDECGVRTYDPKGNLIREVKVNVKDGDFGEAVLKLDTVIRDLPLR